MGPTQPQPDPQTLLVSSMLLHMRGSAEEGRLEQAETAVLTDGSNIEFLQNL